MYTYLAPIHGITDLPFRLLFKEFFGGIDRAVTPFITTVNANTVAASHLRDIIPPASDAGSVTWNIPQLLGNHPQQLLTLIHAMADLGYKEVNWNLGCPFRKITRKSRGSGLLPHPELIVKALEYILPKTPCRLSLKVRLGLTSPTELSTLMRNIEGFPLECIVIHPRLASQLYTGSVDMEQFAAILSTTAQRIVYNGDILQQRSVELLEKETGRRLHGVMIGRGAVINPFLPSEISGSKEKTDAPERLLRCFHDRLIEKRMAANGTDPAIGSMKEFWRYACKPFLGANTDPFRAVLQASTLPQYNEAVDRFFDTACPWNPSSVQTCQPFPAL